uniref:Putative secreted protein n=1 Tax=Anopheles triannulatus TaxID=58253 RepID=A0A2M4B5F3_9DIPT
MLASSNSSALLFLLPFTEPREFLSCVADLRTSPLLPTSPRELAFMAARDGLNRSPVECFRTRSNVGTDPFFGIPD